MLKVSTLNQPKEQKETFTSSVMPTTKRNLEKLSNHN